MHHHELSPNLITFRHSLAPLATTLRHSASTMKHEDAIADHYNLSPPCSTHATSEDKPNASNFASPSLFRSQTTNKAINQSHQPLPFLRHRKPRPPSTLRQHLPPLAMPAADDGHRRCTHRRWGTSPQSNPWPPPQPLPL